MNLLLLTIYPIVPANLAAEKVPAMKIQNLSSRHKYAKWYSDLQVLD